MLTSKLWLPKLLFSPFGSSAICVPITKSGTKLVPVRCRFGINWHEICGGKIGNLGKYGKLGRLGNLGNLDFFLAELDYQSDLVPSFHES